MSVPCKNFFICYSVLSWEDQSNAAHRIVHTVLISCITVLYESYRTVMQLIGQIQHTLGKYSTVMQRIYLRNVTKTAHCKSLKPAKLILPIRSAVRNRLYKYLLIV